MYGEKVTNKMEDETIETIDSEIDEEEVEVIPEETEDTEVSEVETHEVEEETTDWKAEALKQKAIAARLSKKLSTPQKAPVKEQTQTTNKDTLSREEAILIAQGMSPEDLDELSDVARAKNISLLQAKETPLFTAYLHARETEAKKEKAKLGSSKGSSVSQERNLAELSREEHEAIAREMMSKVK